MQRLKSYINNPNKRWAEFKLGLIIFSAGAVLIIAGNQLWLWLQIPGLMVLFVGSLIAAKGYFGILLFRLTNGMRQLKPPPSEFDKDK